MRRAVIVLLAAAGVLAGCTSDPAPTPGRTSTVIDTRTMTRPPPSGSAPQYGYVAPLPPGTAPPKGERDGKCPYIRAGLNVDPTSEPNVADIEGNRVGRVTVLTRHKPVGCRFYFYSDFHPVAEIVPTTYATAAKARAALVAIGKQFKDARGYPDFVKGVDGVGYQTAFNRPDAGNNNAFAFAKGRILVVLRIDQTDASASALYLAQAIVGKF